MSTRQTILDRFKCGTQKRNYGTTGQASTRQFIGNQSWDPSEKNYPLPYRHPHDIFNTHFQIQKQKFDFLNILL